MFPIPLDFADVKTIMSGMGVAMMGTGIAEGDSRAMTAAQKAISSPLLEDASVNGARGVIINVTGGPDLSLMEVNEASSIIQEVAHEDANIIFGAVVDPSLHGKVKITVIATGFDRAHSGRAIPAAATQTPVDLSSYTVHLAARAVVAASAAEPPAAQASVQAMTSSEPMMVAASMPVLTVDRRPALDIALPSAPAASDAACGTDAFDLSDLDLSSPLDVPAFLRRQN